MTIAQQLNVKEFPFIIRDDKGNRIYSENSDGFWIKREWDSNDNIIYFEDSDGYWSKWEYDSRGNPIYFENSNGEIRGNCSNELTLDEIAAKFNIPVSQLKIKK